MTAHRIFNIAAGIMLACAIGAAMATSHLLDTQPDARAEWAESTALAEAQKAARLAARTERAAAQLCVRVKGPNSGHAWTGAGELVCTDNRGGQRLVVAKVAP